MSVLEKALKSIAVTIAEEAKAYGVSYPTPPDTNDPKEVVAYLKQVVEEIKKAAGSSVAVECLEAIEAYLNGSGSEEDILTRCPSVDEPPASPLDPFKE